MITGELKSKVDRVWDAFWSGGISNPLRSSSRSPTYGNAAPVTLPAAHVGERELGIDTPHVLVTDLWNALQESCEARFFSEVDWQRARWELWYANQTMTSRPITANAWAAVQHGLTELLISPAAKRRAAIELNPPGRDADEDAAVSMLTPVPAVLEAGVEAQRPGFAARV